MPVCCVPPRWPWLVTLPALGCLGVALYAASFLGRAFLPDFNEGALTISAVTLPGTSLAESDTLDAWWNRPCWRIPRWCPWPGGPDAPHSTSTRKGWKRRARRGAGPARPQQSRL